MDLRACNLSCFRKFGYKNIITVPRKELDLRNQIKVKSGLRKIVQICYSRSS